MLDLGLPPVLRRLSLALSTIGIGFTQGLAKLPNELFATILEFAASWSTARLVVLSHVNRRFRSQALSLTDAWCDLSSHYSPHQLEAHIARSRDAGLRLWIAESVTSVQFASALDGHRERSTTAWAPMIARTRKHIHSSRERSGALFRFLSKVLPLVNRWRSLHIAGRNMDVFNFRALAYILRSVHGEQLSSLESVFVSHHFADFELVAASRLLMKDSSESNGYSDDAEGHDLVPDVVKLAKTVPASEESWSILKEFFVEWNAPRLRAISLSGFIAPPMACASSLRCFSAKLGQEGYGAFPVDCTPSVTELLAFLRTTPSLRELRLLFGRHFNTVDQLQLHEESYAHPLQVAGVSLPQLTDSHFAINLQTNALTRKLQFRSIRKLLELVDVPQLSHMSLALKFGIVAKDDAAGEWHVLDELVPPETTGFYSQLKRLSVTLRNAADNIPHIAVSLRPFERLEQIGIEVNRSGPGISSLCENEINAVGGTQKSDPLSSSFPMFSDSHLLKLNLRHTDSGRVYVAHAEGSLQSPFRVSFENPFSKLVIHPSSD